MLQVADATLLWTAAYGEQNNYMSLGGWIQWRVFDSTISTAAVSIPSALATIFSFALQLKGDEAFIFIFSFLWDEWKHVFPAHFVSLLQRKWQLIKAELQLRVDPGLGDPVRSNGEDWAVAIPVAAMATTFTRTSSLTCDLREPPSHLSDHLGWSEVMA